MIFEEGMYDICCTCGWEDDPYQRRHTDDNGANKISLDEAKQTLAKGEPIYSGFPRERANYYDTPESEDAELNERMSATA